MINIFSILSNTYIPGTSNQENEKDLCLLLSILLRAWLGQDGRGSQRSCYFSDSMLKDGH